MQTDEFAKIVDCIIHVSPKLDRNIITPRSHLEIDLGLESFDKIDLLSCTENQFKVSIPESIFNRMETVNDLVSFMRDQKFYGIQPAMDRVLSLRDRILGDQIDFPVLPKSSILKQVALPVIRGFVSGANQFSVQNIDILKTMSSPIVFVSNHSNVLDAFWILHSIPETLRKDTYFIAEPNEKYPKIPYSFLDDHIINIEPPNDPIQVVKVSLSIIRNKRNLIVFPEGQVSKNPTVGSFKSAVSLLVKETGATIVPVLVDTKQNGCRVIFGTPFSVPELLSRNTLRRNASSDEISDYLRSVVVSLK
ncbi:MAG: 1-acyl-sn-glycerol-3-phosphate acyltransferase, partial [Fibrobacterota bacterium]